LQAEIKLVLATGIPIPDTIDPKKPANILGREMRVVMFSKNQNKFVGNTIVIPCDWN